MAVMPQLPRQCTLNDADVRIADVYPVGVGSLHHALLEEGRDAVRQHAIALHLAEAQTAVARSALDRLTREDLDRPTCARVDLVVDHLQCQRAIIA